MVIYIKDWIRSKALRYRRIVNSSPKYSIWDVPVELVGTWSLPTLEAVQKEVYLLDVEEAWGPQERVRLESNRLTIIGPI